MCQCVELHSYNLSHAQKFQISMFQNVTQIAVLAIVLKGTTFESDNFYREIKKQTLSPSESFVSLFESNDVFWRS